MPEPTCQIGIPGSRGAVGDAIAWVVSASGVCKGLDKAVSDACIPGLVATGDAIADGGAAFAIAFGLVAIGIVAVAEGVCGGISLLSLDILIYSSSLSLLGVSLERLAVVSAEILRFSGVIELLGAL